MMQKRYHVFHAYLRPLVAPLNQPARESKARSIKALFFRGTDGESEHVDMETVFGDIRV